MSAFLGRTSQFLLKAGGGGGGGGGGLFSGEICVSKWVYISDAASEDFKMHTRILSGNSSPKGVKMTSSMQKKWTSTT